MIDLQNISFSYGKRQVLQGITYRFEPGKFYGIFGANGCGKSTLLKLITGEYKSFSGRVFPVFKNTGERAKQLAFMEQQLPETIPLTAKEVVELGRYPWRKSGVVYSVDKIMEELDLLELQDTPYTFLSGGEKQRVMLARVFAQQTEILLLDEPFSSFDIGNQHIFYRILKKFARQGKCIIMVTHDIFVSGKYLDKAIFLRNGSVYCHGAPGEIFSEKLFHEIYGI